MNYSNRSFLRGVLVRPSRWREYKADTGGDQCNQRTTKSKVHQKSPDSVYTARSINHYHTSDRSGEKQANSQNQKKQGSTSGCRCGRPNRQPSIKIPPSNSAIIRPNLPLEVLKTRVQFGLGFAVNSTLDFGFIFHGTWSRYGGHWSSWIYS